MIVDELLIILLLKLDRGGLFFIICRNTCVNGNAHLSLVNILNARTVLARKELVVVLFHLDLDSLTDSLFTPFLFLTTHLHGEHLLRAPACKSHPRHRQNTEHPSNRNGNKMRG